MIIAEAYLPNSKSREASHSKSVEIWWEKCHPRRKALLQRAQIHNTVCSLATHTFSWTGERAEGLFSLNKKKPSKNAATETQAGGRLREESQFSHTVLLWSHEWKTESHDFPYLPQALRHISMYRPFRTSWWELLVDRLAFPPLGDSLLQWTLLWLWGLRRNCFLRVPKS